MTDNARCIDALAAGRLAPDEAQLESLLSCGAADSARLYAAADRVRQTRVGDEVFLRGIIEFSNYCRRSCDYCGIRGPNRAVKRYRMGLDEVVATAAEAKALGNTTVVLQSGEDAWYTVERLCAILRAIREKTGLAITLSVGERPYEELCAFREAGCARYLLRFETSDRSIFKAIHPDDDYDERLACLDAIRRAGIQVGSGFMIGLPGGTLRTLARDLLFATSLDLDMIGCGPYLPHPETPLGRSEKAADAGRAPQSSPPGSRPSGGRRMGISVPHREPEPNRVGAAERARTGPGLLPDAEIYFRTIALLRLLNPGAHIPATTAFDALVPGGRDHVLTCGANVFMPNVTPARYRALYQLYPNKPCVDEDGAACAACVGARIARLGRTIGKGPGHSLKRSR